MPIPVCATSCASRSISAFLKARQGPRSRTEDASNWGHVVFENGNMRRRHRSCAAARFVGAVLVLILALPLSLGHPHLALGQGFVPADGIFALFTFTRKGRGVSRGTAFFIDPSGLALTNSHVVYRAQHDPENYVLVAIIRREAYGAEVVCASAMDVDPIQTPKGPVIRDVAEIRVTRPAIEFTPRGVVQGQGPATPAGAHVGPLPLFSALILGNGPQEGGVVRIIGFGQGAHSTEKMVTLGTVSKMAMAKDGTPVFEIISPERPDRGSSGSPVVDNRNRVIGIYTWNETANGIAGIAISSAALANACP